VATPNDASKTAEGDWKLEMHARLCLLQVSPAAGVQRPKAASDVDADTDDLCYQVYPTAARAKPVTRAALYSTDVGCRGVEGAEGNSILGL
jgi:hypothetical protein